MNHKQELLELCARDIIRHALGNTKFNHDLQIEYEFLMKEATPEMKELIRQVFKNRGMLK